MPKLHRPDPLLDVREEDLLPKLKEDYEKFCKPGRLSKVGTWIGSKVSAVVPGKVKDGAKKLGKGVSEAELIRKAMEHAAKGLKGYIEMVSLLIISKERTVRVLTKLEPQLDSFEDITCLRSYDIERLVTRRFRWDVFAAAVEGGLTGAFGIFGVPFNIALSFGMYFRAVQAIGQYYGYDVDGDPREMEFASTVTILSLAPNSDEGAETLAALVGRMMLAANMTALRQALKKMTYEQMAKKGGAELLYVQIRALAHKAAQKALEKAGRDGLENTMLRKILEQVGRMLPKNAGRRAIPVVGAFIGAGMDGHYMRRVVRGANLIYHKRFLMEKEHRLDLLFGKQK